MMGQLAADTARVLCAVANVHISEDDSDSQRRKRSKIESRGFGLNLFEDDLRIQISHDFT